jgi:hypothetical protein
VYQGKEITFFAKQKHKCIILGENLCSAMSDHLLCICVSVYWGKEITALVHKASKICPAMGTLPLPGHLMASASLTLSCQATSLKKWEISHFSRPPFSMQESVHL